MKTNIEIAREVIAGLWGNGEARKRNLDAEGYDYIAIQQIVNAILRGEEIPVESDETEYLEVNVDLSKHKGIILNIMG